MRLHSRVLGLLGLLVLAVVAVGLLRGGLTVVQAAGRVGVAAVVLLLADRLLLPLARTLVGDRPPPGDGRL